MPALSERLEDISTLVDHFMRRASQELNVPKPTVSSETMALLTSYTWPGNVRELQNVVERATLLSGGKEVTPDVLPREIAGERPAPTAAREKEDGGKNASLWDYERTLIEQALEQAGWNQSQAARDLGISRDNLRYRIKKYKIKKPARRGRGK
jgi:DNA-binding NtrC family response regulator